MNVSTANSFQERWEKEIAVLSDLNRDFNDKLTVTDGHLHLEKSNKKRRGGVLLAEDPSALATHLEELITVTAKMCFESLQAAQKDSPALKDSSEFYERVADFAEQSDCLSTRISDLQSTFRDCGNEQYAKRYYELCKLAFASWKQVETYKDTLEEPPLEQRPIRHFIYDERTDTRSTHDWEYLARVPVAEIIAAAKTASLLGHPQMSPIVKVVKCVRSTIGSVLALSVLCVAGMLTILKIVLWNPFEWLIRGEIRTQSPFRLSLSFLKEMSRSDNPHLRAYQYLAAALLHRPAITKELAETFKQLSTYAHDRLDLSLVDLVSEDITKLAPYIQEDTRHGAIPLATYLEAVKESCKDKTVLFHAEAVGINYRNTIYLNDSKKKGEQLINYLREFESTDWTEFATSTIRPEVLQELLEAAASSPACDEIEVSDDLRNSPAIRDVFRKHSYRFKKNSTYQRYSTF